MIIINDNLSIDEKELEVERFPGYGGKLLNDLVSIAEEDPEPHFNIDACRKWLIQAASIKNEYDKYEIKTLIEDFMAVVEQIVKNPEAIIEKYQLTDNWYESGMWTRPFDPIYDRFGKWNEIDKNIKPVKDPGNQDTYYYYKIFKDSIILFDKYSVYDVLVYDKNKKTIMTTTTASR